MIYSMTKSECATCTKHLFDLALKWVYYIVGLAQCLNYSMHYSYKVLYSRSVSHILKC